MKRVECGAYMAVEGIWMDYTEASMIKIELKARGTKRADMLVNALTFVDGTIYRGDNDALVTKQGLQIKEALDALAKDAVDEAALREKIERVRRILGEEVR